MAPLTHDSDRIAEPQSADGDQGAVFAKTVTCYERRTERRFRLQHPQRGDRCRKYRRLCVFCKFKFRFRPAKAQFAQRATKGGVSLGKNLFGDWKFGAEIL